MIRSEPYRLFFPLALLMGGAGVGHWLLYTTGIQRDYSGQAHALVQVQSFLMAIAAGFLMTMIPRRTSTAPASSLEIGAIVVGLVVSAVAALARAWGWAEAAFLLVLAVLTIFALRRLMRGGVRPPAAFVLIPIGLLQAAIGAGMVGFAGAAMVPVGRGMLQEGLFLCLILGTGHLVMPVLSGHDAPGDGELRGYLGHAAAGIGIVASFPAQVFVAERLGIDAGTRMGCGLRAAIFLVEALACMRAFRWPVVPGLHRRIAWLAFWMVPLGEALAAAWPTHRVGLLHVTFIGGFGLLAFTIAAHVIGAHGGEPGSLDLRPRSVAIFGLLFLLALFTRVTADLFAEGYWVHVGAAAAIWLAALVAWAIAFLPGAWRRGQRVVEIEMPSGRR